MRGLGAIGLAAAMMDIAYLRPVMPTSPAKPGRGKRAMQGRTVTTMRLRKQGCVRPAADTPRAEIIAAHRSKMQFKREARRVAA